MLPRTNRIDIFILTYIIFNIFNSCKRGFSYKIFRGEGRMTKEIQGGILYKAIENDLKKNLHHTFSCFLQILQQMTTGLSGAEVYLVSLNCSEFSGKYFLKIELEDDVPPDFQGIPFPYAKNVKSFKFGEYVVLLSEPAGLSAIEFKSYRNARPSAQILQEIIESHLRQCQKKRDDNEVSADLPKRNHGPHARQKTGNPAKALSIS